MCVQLVRHLNKSGGRQALYRGLGSIGLVANCRSAWLVAADPRARGRAVLAQVKNNLAPGPAQPGLRDPADRRGLSHGRLAGADRLDGRRPADGGRGAAAAGRAAIRPATSWKRRWPRVRSRSGICGTQAQMVGLTRAHSCGPHGRSWRSVGRPGHRSRPTHLVTGYSRAGAARRRGAARR